MMRSSTLFDSENWEDLGRCACGAQIHANRKDFAVMHTVPWCQAFQELEPDEFLTYVRRSRGIPDPPEAIQ